jgi:hypothetical protein
MQAFPQFLPPLLCLLAGLGKAVADAQAHGSPRLLAWFPRWAALDSWRNKYKQRDPTLGPIFLGSTTVLVALTDTWHAANALTWLATDAALLLVSWGGPWRWWVVGGIVARRVVFEPVYRFLRK